MEIAETTPNRRSKPVLVRLTPGIYDWLEDLATRAGGGVATTIRAILEAAQEEGVEVTSEEYPRRRIKG